MINKKLVPYSLFFPVFAIIVSVFVLKLTMVGVATFVVLGLICGISYTQVQHGWKPYASLIVFWALFISQLASIFIADELHLAKNDQLTLKLFSAFLAGAMVVFGLAYGQKSKAQNNSRDTDAEPATEIEHLK